MNKRPFGIGGPVRIEAKASDPVIELTGPQTVRQELAMLVESLRLEPSVSFVLDDGLRFVYCNPAWDTFAIGQGAPQLALNALAGKPLFNFIPRLLQPFYRDAFRLVQIEQVNWEHLYQCPDPEEFKLYRMQIDPIVALDWFLVRHTLAIKRSHAAVARPGQHNYLSDAGFITMCSHCCRCRRVSAAECWDFVPDYLENRPRTLEDGLCPECMIHYYPQATLRL